MVRSFLTLFFLTAPLLLLAQTRQVSGKVIAESEPNGLFGVNVIVKGTLNGTSTDFDGNYSLTIPDADTVVLVFSYISFEEQEVRVGNQTVINVTLSPDTDVMDEVVITGYGSEVRGDIISSIASVSPEDFKDMPITGIDQALQGQAAGVQVVQSSGTPGGGISVRIRGNTSISASNRPLFIVDGIPVEDGALGLRSFGGQGDNALSTLNPNDIESIQVLKDASAKAIYGSRAANGVVLVTTRRGKSGKTKFSFDAKRGMVDVVKKLELLDASQLLEIQREAVENAGLNPDASGLIPEVTDAIDTDWLDEVLRTGILQEYQLSATGGSDDTRFYLSAGYRDEEGVQLNNRFIRYSATINLDHTINNRLALNSNLTISKIRNDRVKGDNFLDGVYSGAVKSLPFYSPFDENGDLTGPGSPAYPGFPNFNPVAQAVLPRFQSQGLKILGGLGVTYRFENGFNFRSQVSLDYTNTFEDQFEPSSTAIGGFLPSVGGAGYGIYSTSVIGKVVQNNVLSYSGETGKHKYSGLAGIEGLYRQIRASSVQGRLFPSDDFTYITSAGIIDNGFSVLQRNGLLSLFSEGKYSFDDKYYFSASIRSDGSSRFGEGSKFGIFPAVSAGWRISSEKFMDRFEIIEDLKLRASLGYTGNERIGDFRFLGTWGSTTYSGVSGTGPASLGNPELQWERTREFNVGMDLAMYQGRIQVTLDAYSNYTDKLLLTRTLPATTGFGSVLGNVGNLANNGVELTVSTVNIDNGSLEWRSSVNLSRNVNEVIALADTLPIFTGYVAAGVTNTNIVKEGYPLGTFWGLEFLGVDPATGDAIYNDLNGDGLINDQDGTVIGTAQPDIIGGVTNSVRWRNIEMSLFIQFSYGNEMLNFSNTSLLNTGADIQNNQVVKALERWQEPGDITSVPRYELGNTYNNQHSSRFIEDASYARIKNLSLGYYVPDRYVGRFGLSSMKVYASALNLFTITRYTGADPEVSTLDGSIVSQGIDLFTLPQVRTLMVGIRADF